MSRARESIRAYIELARLSNIPTCFSNVLVGCAIGGRKGERREPGLYRLEVDENGDLRLGNRAFGLE